ncbi:helix-turn-helix transcriptional regulator [Chishuiella changwenlii]|jgi:two-component system competent response regulator ComA|uniref:response regulator transcription factor n=1 Tax=Chishuiella changwenlii TaxID=1434701 RepID=UPI002FD8ADCC
MEVELSPKEIQVASLIAKGLSHQEVADTIHRSKRTVESHVRSIYDKTNIKRRLGALTLWFIQSPYNIAV